MVLTVENNNSFKTNNSIETNVIIAFIEIFISIFNFIISFTTYTKVNPSDVSTVLNFPTIISLVLTTLSYLILIVIYYNIHKNVLILKAFIILSFVCEISLIVIFILYKTEALNLVPINDSSDNLQFVIAGNGEWMNDKIQIHLSIDAWAFSLPCLNAIQIVLGVARCFYNKK